MRSGIGNDARDPFFVAHVSRDSAGNFTAQTSGTVPTQGTNLSGTVTTTSGGFNLPADPTRKPGDVQGQNVGTNNIGFNEFGAAAVIGQAGTFTVTPGTPFSITTNRLVNFIAATGDTPVTITRNS